MKKQKYLPFYFKWMERGMPMGGLCLSFDACALNRANLNLFRPSASEYDPWTNTNHWASGDPENGYYQILTPMRQNIILFLAAMNNEL